MPLTTSLAAKLATDFPELQFVASHEFRWSPPQNTVYFSHAPDDQASLLHELSHALLGHSGYAKDIQLIVMERDAWQYAREKLSGRYAITISDGVIQDALDTYRDWLHARSTCPECTATGLQIKARTYKCIACGSRWQVNDARICALRRWKIQDRIKTLGA